MVSRFRKWVSVIIVLTAIVLWGGSTLAQEGEGGVIPLDETERAWLDGHRKLRMGMWLGSPPVMFRGRSGVMEGMVPAYMDLVIKKLGLRPSRVRASSFSAMWELAKAKEVDLVVAVNPEPERTADMLLSDPYLFLPIVIVTRSEFPFITGLEDLDGRVVAMGAEHVPHLRIPTDYPEIVPMPVSDPGQGLLAVISGEADALVASQPTVAYIAREHGITNIRIAAGTKYSYRLSIGVRRDWPMLQRLVNRALSSITEAERKAIGDYWTVLHDGDYVEGFQVWRIVGGVVVAAVVLVLLIFIRNRRLVREVKRREQAEKQCRLAHEATQEVIESADVIIVGLDYTGHVRLLNNAGEAILGYNREELLGRNWFDIVVPKERFPYVWDEFSRLISEGRKPSTDAFENPVLTKGGETRHILWRNSTTDNDTDDIAVVAFGTDITSRLLAEEELRLTQFAMDNAAVGVFRLKPSGQVVYVNRIAANMLGYTRSELKRMSIPDVSPDFSTDNWPEFWERLKFNQMGTTEKMVQRKDGSVFPAEVTAYYLLFKGTELVIGFFSDITERKRVEMLREDVERMVRHDLRSPTLAVHAGFTLLSQADNLTGDQRELLESVLKANRRMINIIDMSRALHNMESGTHRVNAKHFDLLSLARSVMSDLGPLLRAKNNDVALNIEGSLVGPEDVFMIHSEEMLIYALLANLIKNAVEASPDGATVTLDCIKQDTLSLSVHNVGVIPESIRETFFDKYVTLGKSDGTGLGTYTARLITTSLGGDIRFSTSKYEGTNITVKLPLDFESDS